MAALVLSMLALQFWIRTYRYSRPFRPWSGRDPAAVYAPVNGIVAYVRRVQGDDIYCDKGARQVKTPLHLEHPHTQIGFFVGPYDNHHVLAPTDVSAPLHRTDVMDAVNLSMVTLSDRLHGFEDWWDRHVNGFLSHNQRIVFSWTPPSRRAPCYLVIIMDRFINRFFEAPAAAGGLASGDVLGFIGRGSQVDLFLPDGDLEAPVDASLLGQRVDPNVAVGRLRATERIHA
jgi:hypothetical protein